MRNRPYPVLKCSSGVQSVTSLTHTHQTTNGSELGAAQIYMPHIVVASELRRAQTWPPRRVELGRAQTCCPGPSRLLGTWSAVGNNPGLLRSNNNCCIARPMRHSRLLLGLEAAALLGSAGPSEVPETFGDHACAGGVGVSVYVQSCKPPWNGTPPIPTQPYQYPGAFLYRPADDCSQNSTLTEMIQIDDVIVAQFFVTNTALYSDTNCQGVDPGTAVPCLTPVKAKLVKDSYLEISLDCANIGCSMPPPALPRGESWGKYGLRWTTSPYITSSAPLHDWSLRTRMKRSRTGTFAH